VLVYSYVEGETLDSMSPDKIHTITDQQIIDLYQLLRSATQAGIKFDPTGQNFVYDQELGFGVLDVSFQPHGHWLYPLIVDTDKDPIEAYTQHVLKNVFSGTDQQLLENWKTRIGSMEEQLEELA
ncbi:MAG: hypothetical protein R3313_04565, partial [Candidatus Saccharimonadales bacterium]|nr:hypothetical protein [Candidatus Saccharimonadales bacterium]